MGKRAWICVSSGATVTPSMRAWCSVATTGTSSRRAACASLCAAASTAWPSWMAGMRRPCMSTMSSVAWLACSSADMRTSGCGLT
ncbi:Uncharacterised protein [Bordetella pertussis]|nr:Uncharacterised protein [Bordetella pertussis]